jgi:RNA polymerase-binding transcription factor DksA
MLEKTELFEETNSNQQVDAKKTIENTLQKLQALKSRISELRAHFEELQTRMEDQSSLLCDECGRAIEPGEEVEAKNFGENVRHYHQECFQKLWLQ